MRRLMWFTLGFALACAFGAWQMEKMPMLIFAIVLTVFAIIIAIRLRESKPLLRIAYFLLGCGVGCACFLGFYHSRLQPLSAIDGETIPITAIATDFSEETDYAMAVDATVSYNGKSYATRLYLDSENDILPGDEIFGTFRLRLTTPDALDAISYYQGEGVFLLGYQDGNLRITEGSRKHLRFLPAYLRSAIKSAISQSFSEDTYGFSQALLLGDSSALDYETQTAFKLSGIRHIIAVSGLHISILYGFLSFLTFRRRYLTAIVGIPTLFLFAAIAGFTPSVTRAAIMVCLMMIAAACNKQYDGASALAFACLVMLIFNPLTITSISFQLSVASVAGIFLFSEPISAWLGKMPIKKKKGTGARFARWCISSASVSISAVSLTTPLCAYYFGAVSLVGILTNLLTLWAVSFIFYGIICVCALFFLFPKGAVFLAKGVSLLIRYVLAIARVLSRFPLAAVYTKSEYIVIWLAFVYVLLAIFLIMRKKKPFQLIFCGIFGLCIALLLSWMQPLADECRVTVLDVGQGQSILLQSEGKSFLVDCGGSNFQKVSDIASETLLSQGINHLDGLILSHYDDDHTGGVPYFLTRMDADLLIVPDTEDSGIIKTISELSDGEIVRISQDSVFRFGEAKMTIFAPISSEKSNENSLCVLFETPNCAILITGDRSAFGERMLLRRAEFPKIDLLIAGHHGSKTSTCDALLDALQPEVVAISVGENHFGHPSDEVLARLEKYGCVVCRTDENGTIIFRR